MDGKLLFREDFGGNDPDDPIVGTQPVPGMDYSRYTQRTNADHVTGQPGLFWLIKSGYYHADTTGGRDPMQNHSNWYLQDDHTYPNDKTRGYLLEIDGLGGNSSFYTNVIRDVSSGSRLTFSAYVANVNKASNYIDGVHARVYPRLRFELEDANNGTLLASHSTGDIPYDSTLTVNTDFFYSSKWYLHGLTLTVPAGVDSIRLTIYNDVSSNGAGNDFALDDIEIRQCVPTVSILSPDSVCPNDPCSFQIEIENEALLQGPLEYKWMYKSPEYPSEWRNISGGAVRELQISSFKTQHVGWYKLYVAEAGKINNPDERIESEEFYVTFKKCEPDLCNTGTLLYKDDFGGNDPNDPRVGQDPVPGMSYTQMNNDRFGWMGSGRYLVIKEGYCNGDTAALRQQYGYLPGWGSQWILQDDHTYSGDYTRGYFVEIDGAGGESPFYSTTIHDLCPGTRLTFSAYVVNVAFYEWIQKMYRTNREYIYPRMKFVLKNPDTGDILAQQSTGDIQPDVTKAWNIHLRESAEWQLVGMDFIVPEGVDAIQMFIYNDVESNGTGNDFAMDDIEIRLCMPKPEIVSDNTVCLDSTYQFAVDFNNDGTLAEPLEYKWWHSQDSVTWTEMPDFIGNNPVINTIQKTDSGWYKVAVAGAGNIESVNCRAVSEPFRLTVKDCEPPAQELCMDGTLLFREDFGGNDPNDPRVGQDPVQGMTYNQLLDDYFGIMRSGSYLLTKQGYCNGDTSINNLPYNRGSQWHLQDDHTYPNDVTRGYLLEIDGRGDNAVFYTKTIDGLCAGSRLTFSAYVANVMTWGQYVGSPGRYTYPCLKFVLRNPVTTETLATYDTGDIPFDSTYMNNYKAWQFSSQWRLVGMNFTVPQGVEAVTLTISNNTTGYTGNDFALDDIEIRLCMPTPTIISENEVCQDSVYTFDVDFTNDGTLTEPLEYKWWHSTDSITWTEMQGLIGKNPTIETFQPTDTGWYKVAVSGAGNIENTNCRSVSEPFHLRAIHCAGPITYVTRDTTVCDTLMPFIWRGMLFDAPGSQTTMQQNQWGFDSCHTTWTLSTQVCCPDLHYATRDTTVCDTLMPFTWHGLLYNEPGSQTTTLQDDRGCDTLQITWTISLTHCERPIAPPEPPDPPTPGTLYPLIVNKYNWQLLLDNVALRQLFPERTARSYQWYKNEQPIPGANEDDYAEQNELQGRFQLRIILDNNQTIWSNILEIGEIAEPEPIIRKVYYWQSLMIVRYQQADKIWYEKRLR